MINKKVYLILFVFIFLISNVFAEEITLDLRERWNLVSIPLEIENNHPRDVFRDIIDDVERIYTFNPREGALVFFPELPDFINTLDEIDPYHGYWIVVKNDRVVTIEGTRVDSLQIDLRRGWNLISYVGEVEPSEDVFKQISGKFKKIVGFETIANNPNSVGGIGGKLYDPNLPTFINTLKQMAPKLGYWIIMNENAVLMYPLEEIKPEGAFFRFGQLEGNPAIFKTFVIKLIDPKKIQEARDILAGIQTDATHVGGIIVKESVDYNEPWSYHLNSSTIEFFEMAIEVCDAGIQYVEDNLEDAGGAFLPGNRWCPWGSELIEEL